MGLVGTSLVTFGISLAGIVLNYMYYTGEYSGEGDSILHLKVYSIIQFANVMFYSQFFQQVNASCTNFSSPLTCFSVLPSQ